MSWADLIREDELSNGEARGFQVAGKNIALYNVDGEFFATQNICTHAYACLSDGFLEGAQIECPMHQGVFDVRDGKALSGPVDVDLKTFPVRVSGGVVQVDLAEVGA